MKKIIVFGNSGSGKSTLAKELSKAHNLGHLDLDSLAWEETTPPTRRPLKASEQEIKKFIASNDKWVIEGCYSDLLELIVGFSSQIIFMDLPVGACVINAKNRPWEPHKYKSKEDQDSNLDMLIDWIKNYNSRKDTFSRSAHQKFYDIYPRTKQVINSNRGSKLLIEKIIV
jgi:adenylate kinase family enzyme